MNAPIDVVCHKDRFLEQHATFGAAAARDVKIEAGSSEAHPATEFAIAPVMVMPVAPVFLPFVALAVAASPPTPLPDPPFAYRPLPELFLVPATFDSASARDAFFDSLRARLEAAAAARRAAIDKHCRFWPCTPSDVSCPDRVCERQRALVNEQLKTQLDQLPALRQQTQLSAP